MIFNIINNQMQFNKIKLRLIIKNKKHETSNNKKNN